MFGPLWSVYASKRISNPLLRKLLKKYREPTPEELKAASECPICLEAYSEDPDAEKAVKLCCGHLVGGSCFLRWLNPGSDNVKDTCASCRQVVVKQSLLERYGQFVDRYTPAKILRARDWVLDRVPIKVVYVFLLVDILWLCYMAYIVAGRL